MTIYVGAEVESRYPILVLAFRDHTKPLPFHSNGQIRCAELRKQQCCTKFSHFI